MSDTTSKINAAAMARYAVITLATLALLYFGRTLFIPFLLGLLVAMIMHPICYWLERRNISRSVAITICLSIVIGLFAGLLYILLLEINAFSKDIPLILDRLNASMPQLQQWVHRKLFISNETQVSWMKNIVANGQGNVGASLMTTLNSTVSSSFILFMVPVFAALFLYHRGTFVAFLRQIVGSGQHEKLNKVLHETIHTYSNFIKGMVMVYVIVGALNSVGLLALGIRHAVLFGMVTAIMTIVPYVGIIISALLPISVALITKDSLLYPIGVIGVFSFVQYLEANVIFPKVVGTQLNVSTWGTLVAILAGGILWGVAGMILFIPLVAIFKIITDHVEHLEAIIILLNRDKGYKKSAGRSATRS